MARLTDSEQEDLESLLAQEAAEQRVKPLDPATVRTAADLADADGAALGALREVDPAEYARMVQRVQGLSPVDAISTSMLRDLAGGAGGHVFDRGRELAELGPVDLDVLVRASIESGVIFPVDLERLTSEQLADAKRRFPTLIAKSIDALGGPGLPGTAQ